MRPLRGKAIRTLLATSAVATSSLISAAQAQTVQTDTAGASDPDDIVVTAQRRSERLQDVPVSVTAITSDGLTRQRITNASDLSTVVPNLQSVGTVGEGTPIFSLRGVSMSDYSLNQASPVATYFDEVYRGNFALLGVALYDVERVEVLRGPQGTLYGKNTTGGAVNIIAKKPDFTTGGFLSLGYGNYNRTEASGALQLKLSDTLAARVAFTYTRADGWFRNRLAGAPDLNGINEYGIRGTLLFRPSETAEFTLRASTSLQNPRNYGILAQPGPDGIGGGVYAALNAIDPTLNPRVDDFRVGLGPRELTSDYTPIRRNRATSVSLTSTIKLGDTLNIIGVTSWDKGSLFNPEDTDGSALKALSITYEDQAEQVAQDVRLSTNGKGPFNFIVGAYYNRETVFNATTLRAYQDIDFNLDGKLNAQDCIAAGPVAGCQNRNSFNQRKESFAFYGDASLQVSKHLTLRTGLRYSHDVGQQTNYLSQLIGSDGTILANLIPGDPTNLFATTALRFRKGNLSGRAGVDYTDDVGNLAYASFSRGYRASSFNAQAFFAASELTVAKPETVNSYELGFKSRFLGHRLQVNGAIFYYDYTNQQFIDVQPDATQRLLNLPKSRILGVELELTARPSDRLMLSLGFGALDTKIRQGVVQGVSVAGNSLANAPRVSLTGSVAWDAIKGEWGNVSIGLNGSFSSPQFFDVQNKPALRQASFATLGARLRYRTSNDRFGASLWVKNLTDSYYFTSRVDVSTIGFVYNHISEPRTYGVTIDGRF